MQRRYRRHVLAVLMVRFVAPSHQCAERQRAQVNAASEQACSGIAKPNRLQKHATRYSPARFRAVFPVPAKAPMPNATMQKMELLLGAQVVPRSEVSHEHQPVFSISQPRERLGRPSSEGSSPGSPSSRSGSQGPSGDLQDMRAKAGEAVSKVTDAAQEAVSQANKLSPRSRRRPLKRRKAC